ncbi:scarecrow-like protein 33 [Andrographis paniculata]|uniref:scarecrow-like protein 33 n=1 Tax=Andrographis paniculata TaxID=175694 RepID=UPI0021E73B79|nr:scarecrow-like protein 33 [Andrographis paniculata]
MMNSTTLVVEPAYTYSSSSSNLNQNQNQPSWSSELGEIPGVGVKEVDHSDAILRFITQMLMEEEDLENQPCMLHDCLALQATQKSLYDLLLNAQSPTDHFTADADDQSSQISLPPVREKKNRRREDAEDRRSSKQLAGSADESVPFEMYDKVLLCSDSDPVRRNNTNRGKLQRGRKKSQAEAIKVDLSSLLMQCAQGVASFDTRSVADFLVRIREHSSPHGDAMERLAHYLVNAIDARLAGAGTASYAAINAVAVRISAAEILKAYKTYITASPFKKMSNVLANKTIRKLAANAETLHIIDFGILYGYQWPCLIHALSERPGGPPKLRITGIDFPQPGFRPAERVKATGRRLENYCKRFRVPFEFIAIAKKWETIKPEELMIKEGEVVVVNCLYRLHNVPDETVMADSPRDAVLRLIKEINPDMFIHGVVNGTFNTPFFITRFREAMFHYSSLFDMYEATVGREDGNRALFEEHVFGKEVMNIIACEGTERVERPETYKQWQARSVRAGFRQLPLDQELVKFVRRKVKNEYHKDFSVDEEDGKWMLQGWKGRVIHAISYWQPTSQ